MGWPAERRGRRSYLGRQSSQPTWDVCPLPDPGEGMKENQWTERARLAWRVSNATSPPPLCFRLPASVMIAVGTLRPNRRHSFSRIIPGKALLRTKTWLYTVVAGALARPTLESHIEYRPPAVPPECDARARRPPRERPLFT